MVDASGLEGTTNGNRRRGALCAAIAAICASIALTAVLPASAAEENCPRAKSMLMQKARLRDLAKQVSSKTGLKVLAIGSSSTRGIGASSPATSYPARFEHDLERQFGSNVDVVNAGVNGETADATMARLEERITADRYDLVVWQVGTNDAVKGADEQAFRAFVELGVKLVKSKNMDIVLLDPQFFPGVKDPVRYERFVDIIKTVGEETSTPVLSRYKLMKDWAEKAPDDLRTMLSGDGFHMSDRGYYCLANAMASAVTDLIAPPAPPRDQAQPAIASVPRSLTYP
jgi:lysophospholipase L1-like esterase